MCKIENHFCSSCRATNSPDSRSLPDISNLSVSTYSESNAWTPGAFSRLTLCSDDSHVDLPATGALETFNETMKKLAEHTSSDITPLKFQLTSKWNEATPDEKQACLEKAEEACKVVCDIIAPADGSSLYDSLLTESDEEHISGDLVALMTAFADAPTRKLKLQILSIYVYRYPINTLIKLHQPYGGVSKWQIKQARAHAKLNGPGSIPEKTISHRVRIDQSKLDHFLSFINRPYFYQDVAFGMRTMTLNSGEKIEMPNIIRTVTRSTIIAQYQKYCEEEKFVPISRSTMFRILEVREASQRKSLSGLDNTATDGVMGFSTLENIVSELGQFGADKGWVEDRTKILRDSKLYLKVKYPVHCTEENGSLCKDHCRMYALSDPKDKELQQTCPHEHSMKCEECENLKFVMKDIEDKVKNLCKRSSTTERREDMLYDMKQAAKDIFDWKSHILRSTNQENGKQDALQQLDGNTVLVIMDWAMKFQPRKYREKQCEWFGKRGLSWHVSSVISKHDDTFSVQSFFHIIDNSNQDWFSVASIVENLLQTVKLKNPQITKAFLRSDEAGCYHNNMLILACNDLSQSSGVQIVGYDFSEPQSGKDICDRIICPMKSTINSFCNEGHDILSAVDMHTALKERSVKGVTASVGVIDESKNTLDVKKIDGFSKFNDFRIEKNKLRVWRAYGIGKGKVVKTKSLYKNRLVYPSLLQLSDEHGFFPCKSRTMDTKKDAKTNEDQEIHVFDCHEPGCGKSFDTLSDLELHLDVGNHQSSTHRPKENLYDSLRRDWAKQFSTITNLKPNKDKAKHEELLFGSSSELCEGWALPTSSGNVRFAEHVKSYLTTKFDLGITTGNKLTPKEVAQDMRRARNEEGERSFQERSG